MQSLRLYTFTVLRGSVSNGIEVSPYLQSRQSQLLAFARVAIRRKESLQGITCLTDSCGAQTRAMIRQITSYAFAEGAALALMTRILRRLDRGKQCYLGCRSGYTGRGERSHCDCVFVNVCVFLIRERVKLAQPTPSIPHRHIRRRRLRQNNR